MFDKRAELVLVDCLVGPPAGSGRARAALKRLLTSHRAHFRCSDRVCLAEWLQLEQTGSVSGPDKCASARRPPKTPAPHALRARRPARLHAQRVCARPRAHHAREPSVCAPVWVAELARRGARLSQGHGSPLHHDAGQDGCAWLEAAHCAKLRRTQARMRLLRLRCQAWSALCTCLRASCGWLWRARSMW